MSDPKLVYSRAGIRLYHGDCREVVPALGETFAAVVTDPPYGLSFMGRDWDHAVPGVAFWEAFKDAMLPGAHLLAFGGSRTYHRIAVAIEDAGLEIRDTLQWLYGSGFPKSLDVSKAIDRMRKEDEAPRRSVCRFLRAAIDAHPTETVKAIAARFEFHPRMVEHWAARDTDSQPSTPTWEQWLQLKDLLGFGDEMDAEVWRLNGRKGKPGDNWDKREITGTVTEWTDRSNYAITSADGFRRDNPATDAAREWQGWGTALKPAYEPIILARKPLSGTVAANVLEHGTGALNIDGCRVGAPEDKRAAGSRKYTPSQMAGREEGDGGERWQLAPHDGKGRWPANVLMDPAAAAMLDQMSGERPSRPGKNKSGAMTPGFSGGWGAGNNNSHYPDSDHLGASRFFPVLPIDDPDTLRFCLLCARTYAPKHDIMNATQEVAGCNHANTAATSSSPTEAVSGSAPSNAQAQPPHASGDSSRSSDGTASIAASSSGSTQPTRTPTADSDAWDSLTESLVPRVRSAANLCDSCVTATARSLAAMLLGSDPASLPGPDSMPDSRSSILIRSLAAYAEPMVRSGIIPTTASLSILFGSVERAISENTSKASAAQNYESAPTRWIYTPKASRRERNAGLDGLPESDALVNRNTVKQCANCDNKVTVHPGGALSCPCGDTRPVLVQVSQAPRANTHPTVKPLALMRWLLTLVTPPGGTVLDPFAGSGTTGVAAAALGIPCVLVEQEAEYLPIIAGRIDHALDARAGAELPLFAGVAD